MIDLLKDIYVSVLTVGKYYCNLLEINERLLNVHKDGAEHASIIKRLWIPDEEMHLMQLVDEYGNKSWSKISRILKNRSDVQCRYHYNLLINKISSFDFRQSYFNGEL